MKKARWFLVWKWMVAGIFRWRLKRAFRVVERAGFHVCNIQTRGNTHYLVDGNGGFHKIGKRA